MFVRKTDTCIADGLAPVIAIVRRTRLDWQQLLSGLLGGGGDAESLGAHTPQTGGGSSASTACQALQGPVNVREVQGEGVAGSFRHGMQALQFSQQRRAGFALAHVGQGTATGHDEVGTGEGLRMCMTLQHVAEVLCLRPVVGMLVTCILLVTREY